MSAKVHLISGCANREVAADADEVTRCGMQLVRSYEPSPAEASYDDWGEPHAIEAYHRPGETRLFAGTSARNAVTCGVCQKSLSRSWGIN